MKMSVINKAGRMAGSHEFVLLLLLGFLWGIPYGLTKISLTTIPPMTLTAVRVVLAAATLWLVVWASGCKLPERRDFIPRMLLQGCISCAVPYTLIAFGQQTVPSALTAIFNSTGPLFVCIIGLLWTRDEAMKFRQFVGIAIGLGGVVLVFGFGSLTELGHSAIGQLAIIAATLSSAFSVIQGRRFSTIPSEIAAAGTLTAAALVLVPLCFVVEAPLSCKPSMISVAAMLINAIVATALGFVVYFRLIRTIGSLGTASVGYLRPAIGVTIGCLLIHETVTWTQMAGLIAILCGVTSIHPLESGGFIARLASKFGIQHAQRA